MVLRPMKSCSDDVVTNYLITLVTIYLFLNNYCNLYIYIHVYFMKVCADDSLGQ
jgi:hypothetical protein